MRHRATPVTESALLGVAKGALETKAVGSLPIPNAQEIRLPEFA